VRGAQALQVSPPGEQEVTRACLEGELWLRRAVASLPEEEVTLMLTEDDPCKGADAHLSEDAVAGGGGETGRPATLAALTKGVVGPSAMNGDGDGDNEDGNDDDDDDDDEDDEEEDDTDIGPRGSPPTLMGDGTDASEGRAASASQASSRKSRDVRKARSRGSRKASSRAGSRRAGSSAKDGSARDRDAGGAGTSSADRRRRTGTA